MGVIQYGPTELFPRAFELPAGPPSEDAVLVTCAYLVDPSTPWVMQSLFLSAIGEARDRRIKAIEAFGYRYQEGTAPHERFLVHRTVFPSDFLADFGFVTIRTDGRVELARLELAGLVPAEEGRVAKAKRRFKELLAPEPVTRALRLEADRRASSRCGARALDFRLVAERDAAGEEALRPAADRLVAVRRRLRRRRTTLASLWCRPDIPAPRGVEPVAPHRSSDCFRTTRRPARAILAAGRPKEAPMLSSRERLDAPIDDARADELHRLETLWKTPAATEPELEAPSQAATLADRALAKLGWLLAATWIAFLASVIVLAPASQEPAASAPALGGGSHRRGLACLAAGDHRCALPLCLARLRGVALRSRHGSRPVRRVQDDRPPRRLVVALRARRLGRAGRAQRARPAACSPRARAPNRRGRLGDARASATDRAGRAAWLAPPEQGRWSARPAKGEWVGLDDLSRPTSLPYAGTAIPCCSSSVRSCWTATSASTTARICVSA